MMVKQLTRREESRLDRRATIVAVARESFLARGYAATTMSAIAATLGGSKGTLWAHFPSKEALFAAVLDDLTLSFREALEDALRPGRELGETLIAFSERFLTRLLSPTAISLHRLIVGEAGRFPEIGTIFFDRGPKLVIGRLSRYLEDEMAAGRLRAADPLVAARQLIALSSGPQQQRLWNVIPDLSAAEIRSHAERAVAAFLQGYAPAG